jgi:hypothetical protein
MSAVSSAAGRGVPETELESDRRGTKRFGVALAARARVVLDGRPPRATRRDFIYPPQEMPSPSLRLFLAVGFLALTAAAQPGCLLLAAGAGVGAGATWYYSVAREEVDADPRAVVSAAVAALEAMDIAVQSRKASALDGEVIGETARGDRVQVNVTSKDPGRSKIDVRVGLVDDDAARRILDAVLARL